MNRNFTALILIISSIISTSSNSQVTYVNHGGSTNYTLYAGDSLYIASGTYTGTISNWQEGAKISVASGATFQPANFGYFTGNIYIYGSAILSSINGGTSSFRLYNYGTLTVLSDAYLGGNASLQNNYGAVINFNSGVNSNNSTVVNNGTIVTKGDWYSGNGSSLINTNLFTAEGNLEVNGSTAINGGMFYTKKKLMLSGATFSNNCRTIADSTIEITNSTVNNDGLLWASSAKHSSSITNGSTIISSINGKIKSVNFTNNGIITGKGYLYFTGVTTNTGVIGKSGITTDSLQVYDATRAGNSVFDNQYGTIYPNSKYATFAPPDTANAYPSCAFQYTSVMAALPVKWNRFYVNLSNNIPSIEWSSEQEEGVYFEVQRSYNGTDFSSVTVIPATTTKKDYSYQDRDVNTQASLVYYRIKAIELNGSEKFTEIKTVAFYSKQGISIQTVPNPFTSQFNINLQSERAGTLVIKLFSMNGQLQVTKMVMVSKGYNSIAITEAISLAKGFYTVQLSLNSTIIGSGKIVKQ